MIELVWFGISLFAGVVTLGNLLDALRSWRQFRGFGGGREVQAWANVRREILRLLSIAGCIGIIIPALLRDGDTPFSVFVVIAMAIPTGIALNSYLDRRVRRAIEALR